MANFLKVYLKPIIVTRANETTYAAILNVKRA